MQTSHSRDEWSPSIRTAVADPGRIFEGAVVAAALASRLRRGGFFDGYHVLQGVVCPDSSTPTMLEVLVDAAEIETARRFEAALEAQGVTLRSYTASVTAAGWRYMSTSDGASFELHAPPMQAFDLSSPTRKVLEAFRGWPVEKQEAHARFRLFINRHRRPMDLDYLLGSPDGRLCLLELKRKSPSKGGVPALSIDESPLNLYLALDPPCRAFLLCADVIGYRADSPFDHLDGQITYYITRLVPEMRDLPRIPLSTRKQHAFEEKAPPFGIPVGWFRRYSAPFRFRDAEGVSPT